MSGFSFSGPSYGPTVSINAQTGAGYTLVLTDAGKTVTVSNGSDQNLTIPTNASVAFPTGTVITVTNIGAGTWTLTGTPTINGTTVIPNKGTVRLLKTATDTWWASASDAAVGGGLAFITASTFTTSSAVNLNNVFTSTYENYRVLIDITAATTPDTIVNWRYRASAADNTTVNYFSIGYYTTYASTTGIQNPVNGANAGQIGYANTMVSWSMDVHYPQLAQITHLNGLFTHPTYGQSIFGKFNTTTQFDGFSFYPTAGTITGVVRVYGYRNS